MTTEKEKKSLLPSAVTPPTTPSAPPRPLVLPPKQLSDRTWMMPNLKNPPSASSSSTNTMAISTATTNVTTTTVTAPSTPTKPVLTPQIFAQRAKGFLRGHQEGIIGGATIAANAVAQIVPSEVQAVFVVLSTLLEKVKEAQSNKEQCTYLVNRAQTVVPYLQKITESKLKTDRTLQRALEEFKECLENCVEQVSKFGKKNWFWRVIQSGVDAEGFNELNGRLGNAISGLNLGVSLQVASQQELSEHVRKKDQEALCAQVKEIIYYQKEALRAQQKTDLDKQEQDKTISLNLQASVVQLSEKLELNAKAQQQFLQTSLKQLVDAKFTQMESEQLVQTTLEPSYINAKKDISPQLLIALNDIAIQHVIQKGISSTIYQGQWCHHAVAVKLLEGQKATDYALFVREVEIMSRLRHPNITQLYGVCLDPKPGLVMELMLGGSLEMKLEESGALPEAVCCEVAQDIASGLLYLHQRHMYHRDLKTANILINAYGHAKLADFGLSKVHDASVKTAGITGFDKEWIAPEILRAERSAGLRGTSQKRSVASAASDVYSFGLVLWSMLTGKKPLADVPDELEKCNQIIEGRINLTVNHHIPESVQNLILRCCAPNISDRPDMEEVFEQLLDWQKQLNAELSPRTLCVQGREHEKSARQDQAFQCYQKAADKGFADGLSKLGQAFFSGMGCTQDNAKGFEYTQKAAEQGHLMAKYNLGRAYQKGLGCTADKSKAVFWYQKAAEGDDLGIKKQAQEKLMVLKV